MSHDYWESLFLLAAEDDAVRLAEALAKVKTLARVRNRDGTSLVLMCVYRQSKRCLDVLGNRASEYTLHEAAATGRAAECRALVERAPWAIDTLSPDGWTALHLAGFFGHTDAAAALLEAGADTAVWGRAFERNLALHAACAGGVRLTGAIRLIARATADVNVRQGSGHTALMECAGNGNLQSLEELLSLGADPSLLTEKGETARDLATTAGHAECAARLALAASS